MQLPWLASMLSAIWVPAIPDIFPGALPSIGILIFGCRNDQERKLGDYRRKNTGNTSCSRSWHKDQEKKQSAIMMEFKYSITKYFGCSCSKGSSIVAVLVVALYHQQRHHHQQPCHHHQQERKSEGPATFSTIFQVQEQEAKNGRNQPYCAKRAPYIWNIYIIIPVIYVIIIQSA